MTTSDHPRASWETLCDIHRRLAALLMDWLNDPASMSAFKACVIRQFLKDNHCRADRGQMSHGLRVVQSTPLTQPKAQPSYVAPDFPTFSDDD